MTPMNTIAQTLRHAADSLAEHSGSPRLDAELLLGKVLGIGRSALIARDAETLENGALCAYQHLLKERANGTPIAYLTGTREFWSLALKVTPAVLVPRPETETLVELALKLLPPGEKRSVLDLGTGSGAIALAIASERPLAEVTGIDLSPPALAVAGDNARALGLSIHLRLGSWFDAVRGERFDLAVANPPYVAAADRALESLSAEPVLALVSGPTGLEALQAIVRDAAAHLAPKGSLLLEHGSGQRSEVVRLLEEHGFGSVRSHDDYSGLPRVTLGTLHSSH
jgi:release factor glutamine methyltransferase